MDLSEYVRKGEGTLAPLSSESLVSIEAMRDMIRKSDRPIHYLTALRLVRASKGEITIGGLRRRGPFVGENMFDGALGRKIAALSSEGDTFAMRLLRAGIRRNYMVEVLSRGAVPRPRMLERLQAAFGPTVTLDDFTAHAAWRREHVVEQDEDGESSLPEGGE